MKLYTTSALAKLKGETPERMSEFTSIAGEKACFQIVADGLDYPKFGASVTAEGGEARIFRVGEAANDLPFRGETDDGYLSKEPGLFPDPLIPIDNGKEILKAGQPTVFYAMVETPAAGEFKMTVRLRCDGQEESVKIEIRVFTVAQTEDTHRYTDWMHYDAIAREHGVGLFDDAFYEVFETYLGLAVESGVNMLMVPAFTPELDTYFGGDRLTAQLVDVARVGGEYRFGFDRLARFLDFVTARGIRYYEFPPLFSQWDAAYAVKFEIEENGTKREEFGWKTGSADARYLSFLKSFLEELANFLRARGVIAQCYFHLSDELKEAHTFTEFATLMKDTLSGARFFDTVANAETPRAGFEDVVALHRADEGIARGIPVTAVYYCWEQGSHRISNRFLSMPLARTAVIGAQMFGAGVTLLLHWGFNFYNSALSYRPADPYSDTTCGGVYPGGDAFVVYPDRARRRALPSLRLEVMRRAFMAYRLLETIAATEGRSAAQDFLKQEGIVGFSVYPEGTSWYDGFEKRLIERAAGQGYKR